MQTTTGPELCSVCNKPADEHVGMRHPFTPKGASTGWLKPGKNRIESATATPRGSSIPREPMPFDPVLRQALISKRVITPSDLDEAEKIIRSLGLGGALGGSTESQESADGQ